VCIAMTSNYHRPMRWYRDKAIQTKKCSFWVVVFFFVSEHARESRRKKREYIDSLLYRIKEFQGGNINSVEQLRFDASMSSNSWGSNSELCSVLLQLSLNSGSRIKKLRSKSLRQWGIYVLFCL